MNRIVTPFLLFFLLLSSAVNAQITINTTVGSTGYTGNNSSGTNTFITFVVENNTGADILMLEVGNWTTTSHNGTTSTLYYSTTSLSGPITGNAVPAPGWTNVASGLVSGITTTGVNTVLSNINLLIPNGATWRFALHTTGTNHYSGTGVGTASPNTFTAGGGITLRTGDYQIAGQYVGYGYTNNPRFFTGYATFMPATPCSGQPTAGTATATMGCPTSVDLTGFTLATGITRQWQMKDPCTGVWVDIPGANGVTHNISSLTSPTEFRAYVVCGPSGLSDTSNAVLITNASPCYCSSAATSTVDTEIFGVSVGSMNNPSTCTSVAGPGSLLNRYANYTTMVPPPELNKGDNVPFSVSVGSCGGSFSNGTAVFVDFNGDGDFTDAGEKVYFTPTSAVGANTVSGTFTIPANAMSGVTGLRVVTQETTLPANITPCGTYSWGETEDYLIKILYAPNVAGAGTYCSGDTINLVGTAPGIVNPVFLWSGPGGISDTGAVLRIPNAQTSHAGNYTLRILEYPCGGTGIPDTSGPRTVSVTVNQTPNPPVVAPVITYCQNDAFDTIPIFGQNLTWYTVPVGGVGSTVEPTINTQVFGTYTFYVSQTVNGCESDRAPVTINVVAKPVPPTVVSPVVYCQGETPAPLIATGQNILWYSIPTGGVGTPLTPTPGTNAQGTFTWYVSQTVSGCESDRVPVEVKVSYVPNALITQVRPYVCQYDTLTLGYFGNADSLADYLWTLPNGASIVSGSGAGPLVVRFDTAGVQRVKLQVDNGGCKGPEAYKDIIVRISPVVNVDVRENACQDELVHVAVNYATEGIDEYMWDFQGGTTSYSAETAGPYGVTWDSPGDKVITVVARNEDCFSLPFTDTIAIRPLPDPTIHLSSNQICVGDTIDVRANYEPGNSYQWSPVSFFPMLANGYEQTAVVTKRDFITLNVTNEYNCRASQSTWIEAGSCCNIALPNAFTPNNDGQNDLFRIIGRGKQDLVRFVVQNRWGQTVFETTDDTRGWDGTFNGKPQDMGVYFFYVKYNCQDGQTYEKKGELMLVR